MNLGKQAKGSVTDPSWIFISRLKVMQRDACVRDNPIWVVSPSGDDCTYKWRTSKFGQKMYRKKWCFFRVIWTSRQCF